MSTGTKSQLTLDLVARLPRPGAAAPDMFSFSPDGSMLTYLHTMQDSLDRVLWLVDVDSGDKRVLFAPERGVSDGNVSLEEALRRERQRLLHTGVTYYEWALDASVILVPLNKNMWLVSPDGVSRLIGSGAVNPHISPSGESVAFLHRVAGPYGSLQSRRLISP